MDQGYRIVSAGLLRRWGKQVTGTAINAIRAKRRNTAIDGRILALTYMVLFLERQSQLVKEPTTMAQESMYY